jgi:hypothetical protein
MVFINRREVVMKSKLLFSGALFVIIIFCITIFPCLSFADRYVCYNPVTKKSVVVATPSLCPPKNILVTVTDADLASLKNQQSEPQQKSLNTEVAMELNCSPQTCKWIKSPMTSPTCEVKYCCCTKNLGMCEIAATRNCSVQRFPNPAHGSVPR